MLNSQQYWETAGDLPGEISSLLSANKQTLGVNELNEGRFYEQFMLCFDFLNLQFDKMKFLTSGKKAHLHNSTSALWI